MQIKMAQNGRWAQVSPSAKSRKAWLVGVLLAGVTAAAQAQTAGTYTVTNIMSDGFVSASVTDPAFIDPWGVSGGKTLWIDTAGTGFSFVTSIAGAISFKAIVPPASGTGNGQPTGTIQNTTTAGFVLSNGTKASFLFATVDGTVSGWNGALSAGGNHSLIAINNSSKNAVYTDLALVTNASGSYLLIPNFGQGVTVEIYDQTFKPAALAGSFTDPNIPTGYAPYSVKVLGSQVFVSYMLRTTPPFPAGAGSYQEILGTNTGFVSVFDTSGNFVKRVVTGGNLNAPWGIAIAPVGFGIYAGDLLIGNFGDGLITVYNPTTYAYLGVLADNTGKAIAYPGLWEIFVANGTGDPTAIYFTAGLSNETHGLFGSIANSTTSTTPATFNLSASTHVASVAAGSAATITVSVAPINSFAGTVNFSCSGLPLNATCSFSPSQVSVTATAPATATLTVTTLSASGRLARPGLKYGMTLALLLPLGFLSMRRRISGAGRLAAIAVAGILTLGTLGVLAGCSYDPKLFTPAGTSNLTITATSGNTTQNTGVSMTVQ
jgi:uncharacterized protein (TIGR03118 family)